MNICVARKTACRPVTQITSVSDVKLYHYVTYSGHMICFENQDRLSTNWMPKTNSVQNEYIRTNSVHLGTCHIVTCDHDDVTFSDQIGSSHSGPDRQSRSG